MTDYRATPDQWEKVLGWSEDRDVSVSCDAACILELRARVEALEAKNKPGFMKLSVTTATVPTPKSPCSDSLVERVGDAINEAPGTIDDLDNMARAAIQEVAAWLREYRGDEVTAKILEEEIANV